MIDIVNIGAQKTKYNDKDSIKFESLNFYLTLAKKSIAKFSDQVMQGSSKRMLQSEDAIANIANGIMMADWRWDKDRKGSTGQSKTRYSYRNQCAIWAIKSYITRQYGSTKNKIRNSTLSLDSQYDNDLSLKNLIVNTKIEDSLDALIGQETQTILKQDIEDLLESDLLTERQSQYIRMYFFKEMTLEQIGKEFNITREAVRQGLNKAYATLRNILEND